MWESGRARGKKEKGWERMIHRKPIFAPKSEKGEGGNRSVLGVTSKEEEREKTPPIR